MEVSVMDSVTALPHKTYLSKVLQMLSLLKIKGNSNAVLDPDGPEIELTQIPTEYQSAAPCYPCKEYAPSNAPSPRGT